MKTGKKKKLQKLEVDPVSVTLQVNGRSRHPRLKMNALPLCKITKNLTPIEVGLV